MLTIVPKLFIDVDGVMLRRTSQGFQVAEHALTLLTFAVDHFDTFWLTARSNRGNTEEVERAFRLAYHPTYMHPNHREYFKLLVAKIPTAEWQDDKSDAFPLDQPFFWLDDNPTDRALQTLRENDALDNYIHVRTDSVPDDLLRVRDLLAQMDKK